MAITIDTLKIYERLKKTDLSDAASHEIAEVFREATEAISSDLATKRDVELIRRDVELIIQRETGKIWIEVEKIRGEIEKVRGETGKIWQETGKIWLEIEKLRGETGKIWKEVEKVRGEIALTKSDIIKWVAGMLVAQAIVIATLVKLF